jgi:hypothetical protein
MPTDIEKVRASIVLTRVEVERIIGTLVGVEDTGHLAVLLTAAKATLEIVDLLLGESVGAEKFWQIRQGIKG